MPKAVLLTSIPSPYMVEIVDAINSIGRWNILVIYDKVSSNDRLWKSVKRRHEHVFLDAQDQAFYVELIDGADLVVMAVLWGHHSDAVLRAQRWTNTPLVFWGERPGAVRRNIVATWIRRVLISWRFSRVRGVWGIGSWAVAEFRRCIPKSQQFENLPYASELTPYFNIERGGSACHQPIRFLYSGALIGRKGVDLLVPAFIKLLEEGGNAILTLMGHGELETQLKAQVSERYRDKVSFLGFKDWAELPSVYALHDVLVAPSRYDGWGLIVVEGLAAGMPVIATDMMGAAIDFIREGENGWVIPAGSGEALHATMKATLAAPLLKMGRAARLSVESWSLNKAAERWCDLADAAVGLTK